MEKHGKNVGQKIKHIKKDQKHIKDDLIKDKNYK